MAALTKWRPALVVHSETTLQERTSVAAGLYCNWKAAPAKEWLAPVGKVMVTI